MEQDQKPQQSNTKNEYELKRQKKMEEENRKQRIKTLGRFSKTALIVLIVGAGIGAFGWRIAKQPKIQPSDVISRSGIHWHPELTILAKGEKQEISANIGLGVVHQPIHTHDTSGVLHLEIRGLVRKEDTTLGRFFKIWGKDFMEFGSEVSMTVNGEENTDLANYEMKDGDKIELRYE